MFVPGDSEKKLAKAPALGADVIIIDLEDAVAPEAKDAARALTRDWLAATERGAPDGPQYWVRINPLDGPLWQQDVAAIVPARPAGLMIPKVRDPDQLQRLIDMLDEQETRAGLTPGATRLLPLVSETPQAANAIPAWGRIGEDAPRLAGLTWGAEDLSAAIGATRKHDAEGRWTDLFRMVRAQVLLAAHAAGVAAIDTLHADFRDTAGLERVARESHADGFSGMLAIHPSQVPIINAAFTPGEAELAEARAIVDLFAANPGAGALQLDGRMIDQPHLVQARKLLARAD